MKLLLSFTFLLAALASATDIETSLKSAGIKVVGPTDPAYATDIFDYNLRFHYQPALIAYPTNAAQVSKVVKAGTTFNLPVTARSGGHSFIANALGDGRLVVDLSLMKNITVLQNGATVEAHIGAGNRLGDIALALNEHGRAIPHGLYAYVGIGGHGGHGGYGLTSRLWGLNLDRIIEVEVVLANGTVTNASLTTNPDLFWGIRGSSSSFGIVTDIVYDTLPRPDYAIAFEYVWNLDYTTAAQAISDYQVFVNNIPQELGLAVEWNRGNASGFVTLEFGGAWYGAEGQVESVLQPFLSKLPTPSFGSLLGNGTWIDNIATLAQGPLDTSLAPDTNATFYVKSLVTPQEAPMDDNTLLQFMKYLATEGFSTPLDWFVQIGLYGGNASAINAVPQDATGYTHRDSMFTMQIQVTQVPVVTEAGFSFVEGVADTITGNMPPDWDYGSYLNYIDDRLVDWQHRYYGVDYPRLQALKRSYDPTNLFRFPKSIEL
ncbi:glucooligosaccharide oxidase [Mycena alexandri]|uniref:Glucooligosaccharide oxidase n=1 Tax=Mycena alexandri TaxID=1745969 RepID=A0AAD6SYL7_9AGAR|nr:glucooligosaccharide oxidase [Mycena alexandri]